MTPLEALSAGVPLGRARHAGRARGLRRRRGLRGAGRSSPARPRRSRRLLDEPSSAAPILAARAGRAARYSWDAGRRPDAASTSRGMPRRRDDALDHHRQLQRARRISSAAWRRCTTPARGSRTTSSSSTTRRPTAAPTVRARWPACRSSRWIATGFAAANNAGIRRDARRARCCCSTATRSSRPERIDTLVARSSRTRRGGGRAPAGRRSRARRAVVRPDDLAARRAAPEGDRRALRPRRSPRSRDGSSARRGASS